MNLTPQQFQALTFAEKLMVYELFAIDLNVEFIEDQSMNDDELDKLSEVVSLKLFYLRLGAGFFALLRFLTIYGEAGRIKYLDIYPISDSEGENLVAAEVTMHRLGA
jgi:hypothetical protein